MEYRDEQIGIFLRPIRRSDAPYIIRWRNNKAVKKNFIHQEKLTFAMHRDWVKTKIATGEVVQMIICDSSDESQLGTVYIRDIDRQHNKAEYGIFIGEYYARDKGVGTAAAKLMLKYCFEEAKLHRVYLRVFADNIRAIRSYEKAGFVREGLMRDDVCINGEYKDIVWMAAVAREGQEKIE